MTADVYSSSEIGNSVVAAENSWWLTRWARSLALMAAGAAIAFTAVMHTNMTFNRITMVAAFALIAVASILESRDPKQNTRVLYAQAALAAVAALLQLVTADVIVFSLVIAGWAFATAALEFMNARIGALPKNDARLLIIFALLLGVAVIVARQDSVATIGFFGAYGVLSGVFLAIAIADARLKHKAAAAAASLTPDSTPTSDESRP